MTKILLNQNLNDLNNGVIRVRYAKPMNILCNKGYELLEKGHKKVDVLIHPFRSSRGQYFFSHLVKAKYLILDIYDVYHGEKKEILPTQICRMVREKADLITVTTDEIKKSLLEFFGEECIKDRVRIIEDPYYFEPVEPFFSPGSILKIGWFGAGPNFSKKFWSKTLDDLFLREKAFKEKGVVKIQIRFFSYIEEEDFIESTNSFVELKNLQYSIEGLKDFVRSNDVIMVPTYPNSKYFNAKSHNRIVDTLMLGVPAIASPISSYKPFCKFTPIDEDLVNALLGLLGKKQKDVEEDIISAQKYIKDNFSPELIASKWISIIEEIVKDIDKKRYRLLAKPTLIEYLNYVHSWIKIMVGKIIGKNLTLKVQRIKRHFLKATAKE